MSQHTGLASPNDVFKEDQRKGEVLRLLTSAEAREQQAQEYMTAATAPVVLPAVQNQNSLTELPNGNTASPPAQTPRPPPPPPPPRTPTELASHTPSGDAAIPGPYTYYPVLSPEMPPAPGVPAQQIQHAFSPDPAQPLQQAYPIASPPLFPSPMPSEQSSAPSGYPKYAPSPRPSIITPRPYSTRPHSAGPHSTRAHLVPKPLPQQMPPNAYNPGGYNYTPGGRPVIYAPPPGAGDHASAMTLGPDGLWQPVNAGVQRSASQRSYVQSAAPPNYPTGVYEMAS